MTGLHDTPFTKVFVRNKFIKYNEEGFTEAYIYSVKSMPNRPLLFNVHTVDSALYSGLPIWALCSRTDGDIPSLPEELREPWGCLGQEITIIEHRYLKGYFPHYIGPGKHIIDPCRYLWTIDFMPTGGFEDDPIQAKQMHFVELPCGNFGLFPNNYLAFKDSHFTTGMPKGYKRNTEYYLAQG